MNKYIDMKTIKTCVITIILLLSVWPYTYGVGVNKDLIKIRVVPDKYDWNYKVGQDAVFNVLIEKDNQPVKDVTVYYECGPEQMQPVMKDSLFLKSGKTELKCKGLKSPGFLTCKITLKYDGRTYSDFISVAYEPDKIQPTTSLPDDFEAFWENQKKKLQAVPLAYKIEPLPSESTEDVDVYQVRINHYPKGTYIYGILCKPRKAGKYPAVLRLPGAGVTKHKGDKELAAMGVITFQIGIHGIPLDLPDEAYLRLKQNALSNYMFYGLDDKETYYYNRVYLSCVKANDFLTSLPEYDGENLAVYGGSQGGALSIVTAFLDQRVKYLAAFYPALCDLTGYQHGRAGGWPHFNSKRNRFELNTRQAENSRYYDVVNFARYIRIPGFYSWGYCDATCPPTSYYSAYNQISAGKDLYLIKETGHWRFTEQNRKANEWLVEKLAQ